MEESNELTSLLEQSFRFSNTYGVISYPACTLWAYKLAAGIIDKVIDAGLRVSAHTPALKISPVGDGPEWLVKTSRGSIKCRRIFHATNGYVSSLLPELAGKVVPTKGHVVVLQPSPKYAAEPLDHSAGVQWGEDFDYMIQRPSDGNLLIYGGRDLAHPHGFGAIVGDADDRSLTRPIIEALQDFPARYMNGWERGKSEIRYAWSSIMGFTQYMIPLVGAVPSRQGKFLAAGYSGHGELYATSQILWGHPN